MSVDNLKNQEEVSTAFQFFIEEWKGPEDVLSLANYGLDWLQELINEYIETIDT